MRTAITIGITKKGKAEIIHHPDVPLHKQRTDLRNLGTRKGKYAEIQFIPSKGRIIRRRFTQDDKGGVNYNAAHLVENQQAKGKKKKKLADLTPKQGETGGVNMDAALLVEDQGKAKKSKSRKTTKSRRGGKKAARTKSTKATKAGAAGTAKPKSEAKPKSRRGDKTEKPKTGEATTDNAPSL